MSDESDYSFSNEDEEEMGVSSQEEEDHEELHGLDDDDDDDSEQEQQEGASDQDDDDDDRLEDDFIASFLNQAEDIPTALLHLQGTSSNVVENMKLGQMLGGKGIGPVDRRGASGKRVLSSSDDEDDYREDTWDEQTAERLGVMPAINPQKEQRRRANMQKRIASGKTVKDRSGMPVEATAKLGKGNLKYMRGEYEDAEALFMDCIRLAPTFPDAYMSLSRLYEEKGDMKKSMNFLMVAAYLSKKDAQIWKDAAIKSQEQGALRQAVHCYNQVIRREKDDLEWRYARGGVFLELNMKKKALDDFLYYRESHPENPDTIKTVTRLLFQTGRIHDAKEAIRTYIVEYPDTTDLTHINLLAELYTHADMQGWKEILELMELTRRAYNGDDDGMPPELESKEAIAYAHVGQTQKSLEISERLLEKPVEVFPDVFLFIASSYQSLKMYDAATPFFEKLACQEDSNVDIWKEYAFVRGQKEGKADESLDAWEKIVETMSHSNPHYIDAVIELSGKLLENGNHEQAVECLKNLDTVDLMPDSLLTIPENVYMKRAHVLKACARDDLYIGMFLEPVIKSLQLILHSAESSSRKKGRKPKPDAAVGYGDDLFVWQSSQEKRRKKGRAGIGEQNDDNNDSIMSEIKAHIPVLSNPIKEKKSFKVVLYLVKALLRMDRVHDAYKVCDLTVTVLAKKHPNKERRDTMKMYLADCNCRLGDFSSALKYIKAPAELWPESIQVWNIFTKITLGVGGVRQTAKYIAGMRKKFPESFPLALLSGHVHLQNQHYGQALAEYMHAYRLNAAEPIVKLCLSNVFANYACSTRKDRDLALVHAFSWMQEYGRATRNPLETAYNAGRIAHQCSLLQLAVPLYKEAIMYHDQASVQHVENLHIRDPTVSMFAASCVPSHPSTEMAGADVSREAAFNLALIFRESGSPELAKDVMRRYLVF
jgi:general transcription factor 3C polypeptide 3 (transcription factor C subunit 4)